MGANDKVGDRVRLTKDNYGFGREGDEVTIIKIDDGSAYCRFDYLIENDFDWFVPLSSLVAAAPQQHPLTIRAGRYYKTRDGRKVGPMRAGNGPWFEDDRGFSYYESGKRLAGVYEDKIISEWPTHNANPADEVDNMRDECGLGGGAAGSTAGFTVPLVDDDLPPVAEATSGKDDVEFGGYGEKIAAATGEESRLVAAMGRINEPPATIADIVRRLEALEGATNDTHVRIGNKVTLRATVTGKQKKTRINITLDDVSGASHSLVVPATALTLAA